MTVLQPSLSATDGRHRTSPSSPSPSSSRRSMSIAQRAVVAMASIPLIGIVTTVAAAVVGIISTNEMVDVSLALGEEPGMFVFAAMLWCTPVQWLVKRTQVPVRKVLGILFGGYAIANFTMFAVEEGIGDSFSEPFLVAGTLAMLAAIPLLVTSGRWAQRRMGMRNWRRLHKLTYFIALALVLHVVLLGDAGVGALLILAALAVRIPPIPDMIRRAGRQLRGEAGDARLRAGADTNVARSDLNQV